MLKSTQVCHIAKYIACLAEQNGEGALTGKRVQMKVNVLRINKGRGGAESGAKTIFVKAILFTRLKCIDVRTNSFKKSSQISVMDIKAGVNS